MNAQVSVRTAYSQDSYHRMRREAGDRLVGSGYDILSKVRAGVSGPFVIVVPDLPAAEGAAQGIIEDARKLGVTVDAD